MRLFRLSALTLAIAATLTVDAYATNLSLSAKTLAVNNLQNSTFVDSSSNNATITKVGSVYQTAITPFSPNGYGCKFGGVSDYVNVIGADGSMGTGDFCCEAEIMTNSVGSIQIVVGNRVAGDANVWQLGVSAAGKAFFASGTANWCNGTTALLPNKVYHIAGSRITGVFRLFLNGNLEATYSPSAIALTDTRPPTIGAQPLGAYPFNGIISNCRVVKGNGIYSAPFTPPTGQLTSIAGTLLLCLQDRYFKDNSSNHWSFTYNGAPAITARSLLANVTPYSPSVHGGSGVFPGSSYLTFPANAAYNLPTGDFTLEAIAYQSTRAAAVIAGKSSGVSNATSDYDIELDASGHLVTKLYYGTSVLILTSTAVIPLNALTHVAVVRQGNVFTQYIDGVASGTATNAITLNSNTATFVIGAAQNGASSFTGLISSVRLVKGTAVYTGTFTPLTSLLTAVSGTSLLCNFANAGIYDSTMQNNIQLFGNAMVSIAVTKWGGGSLKFHTAGDYVALPANVPSTGLFTLETWIYSNGVGSTLQIIASQASAVTANRWTLALNGTSGILSFNHGTVASVNSSVAVTANGWHHVAVTRDGNNVLRLFIDGALVATSAAYTATLEQSQLTIGGNTTNNTLDGYIENFRCLPGVVEYTAAFTPPSNMV